MKKILFILFLITISFAQIRIEQLPDADTTLSSTLQRNSLLILNQDPTGLGGANYKTRKIPFGWLSQTLSKGDTNFVFRNTINKFYEDNYFYNGWLFGNDNARIGSESFLPGFSGAGLDIRKYTRSTPIDISQNVQSGYTMTLDNLILRGNLYANNYIINSTKLSDGDYFFTQGAVVDSVYYVETTSITYANGAPIILENGDTLTAFPYQALVTFEDVTNTGIAPYTVGDLLEYKQSKPLKDVKNEGGYLTRRVRGIVRKVIGRKVYIDLDQSSIENEFNLRAAIRPGYSFARVGSTVDSDRDGSVYVDVSSPNSPKIIVYDNVNSFATWDSFDKVKVVLGNLDGIIDPAFSIQPSGYGLYGENIFLKGQLVITGGSTYDEIVSKLDSTRIPISLLDKTAVEAALEEETIIVGGFIATSYLTASNITVGDLNGINIFGTTLNTRQGLDGVTVSGNNIHMNAGSLFTGATIAMDNGTSGLAIGAQFGGGNYVGGSMTSNGNLTIRTTSDNLELIANNVLRLNGTVLQILGRTFTIQTVNIGGTDYDILVGN